MLWLLRLVLLLVCTLTLYVLLLTLLLQMYMLSLYVCFFFLAIYFLTSLYLGILLNFSFSYTVLNISNAYLFSYYSYSIILYSLFAVRWCDYYLGIWSVSLHEPVIQGVALPNAQHYLNSLGLVNKSSMLNYYINNEFVLLEIFFILLLDC